MFWDLFKKRTKSINKEKISHVNVKEELAKNEPIDLIRFFRNERPDNQGRYHKDILQYDADFIERKHDFIQWIFPTMEKSGFNPDAPTIDEDFKERFQKDEWAKSNYCASCRLYLNYIGFHCERGEIRCVQSGRIYELSFHNYLRITRMLNSLNHVGNHSCSANLYQALMKEVKTDSNKIDENTLEYWKKTQKINKTV